MTGKGMKSKKPFLCHSFPCHSVFRLNAKAQRRKDAKTQGKPVFLCALASLRLGVKSAATFNKPAPATLPALRIHGSAGRTIVAEQFWTGIWKHYSALNYSAASGPILRRVLNTPARAPPPVPPNARERTGRRKENHRIESPESAGE